MELVQREVSKCEGFVLFEISKSLGSCSRVKGQVPHPSALKQQVPAPLYPLKLAHFNHMALVPKPALLNDHSVDVYPEL